MRRPIRTQRDRLAEAWGVAPTATRPDPDVVVSRDGMYPVLRLRREDGTWVSANSARAPVREARDLLATRRPPESSVLVVIGLGLGYLLEALEERSERPVVIALEPSSAIVEACLERRDWAAWIDARRLLVSCAPDFAELSTIASADPDLFLEPAVLVHPVIARERPAFVRAALEGVARARAGAAANADARRRFAAPYLLNTLSNLPAIRREADAAVLSGVARGLPAVVVGAGPSLDRVYDALRTAVETSVVIATDTAARPLLSAGVVPHAIVSIDPAEMNGRHLRDLVGAEAVALVAEASLWPAALDGFSGRTFLFRVARHEPWPWLEASGLSIGTLRAWGSVITSAVDLAMQLGCARIALVGADCAAVGGQPYARGTTFEATWAHRVLQGTALPQIWERMTAEWTGVTGRDVAGRDIETGPHLIAFRDWLVAEAMAHDGLLFNASGQGLLHGRGVTQIALEEFLTRFGQPSTCLRGSIAARHAGSCGVRAADACLLPAPLDVWRPILEAGGFDGQLAARVVEQGRSARPGGTDESPRVLVSPPAEAAAILHSFVEGRLPPAWARTGLSRVAEALATPDVTRYLPSLARLGPHRPAPNEPFMPSRASGLAPAERDALARIEHAVARRLADAPDAAFNLTRATSEAPMTLGRAARGVVRIDAPAQVVTLLQMLASGVLVDDRAAGDDLRLRHFASVALRGAVSAVDDRTASTPLDATAVGLEIALAGARTRATVQVSASAMARALAGLVFAGRLNPAACRWHATIGIDGDAPFASYRLAQADGVVSQPAGSSSPRALGAAQRFFQARTLGTHARLAPLLGRETADVSEAGDAAAATTWPTAILGELPWDEHGAFAWSNADRPAALLREHVSAPVRLFDLPFRPGAALTIGCEAYLAGVSGGLWRWTPGSEPQLLADTPPIRSISLADGGLRLDPAFLDARGATTRVRLDRAWLWRFGTASLEAIALDDRGPSWSVSRGAGGWTARAFPCASAIEIESPRGSVHTLICPFPFSVAWAGRSLVVVVTTGGEAWFFDRLTETLPG